MKTFILSALIAIVSTASFAGSPSWEWSERGDITHIDGNTIYSTVDSKGKIHYSDRDNKCTNSTVNGKWSRKCVTEDYAQNYLNKRSKQIKDNITGNNFAKAGFNFNISNPGIKW